MSAQEKKKDASPALLRRIIKNPDDASSIVLMKHFRKGGLLAPLGTLLGKLLEDPVLKQIMQNDEPDVEKFN